VDTYTAAGQQDKAQQTAESVIEGMNNAAAGEKKNAVPVITPTVSWPMLYLKEDTFY